tara:strand:+ start:88 stop:636 length:549 start_codon:yes stop_codon:yes gene_type:complete
MKKYILAVILFSSFIFANSQEKKEGTLPLPQPYFTFSKTLEFEEYQFELENKIYDELEESVITDIDKRQEALRKRSFDERKKEFSLMDVYLNFNVDYESEYWIGNGYVTGSELEQLEFEQNLLIESIDVKFNDENFVCNGNKFSDIVKKRILKAKKGDIIIVRVNYTGKIPTQNEALVHTFE